MEREERIRHQKEFLIKFAYWAVWGGLVLAAVKLIGPVLLPFIAAFFVAWILSFPVVFVTERMHIRRGIAAVAVVLLFYGSDSLETASCFWDRNCSGRWCGLSRRRSFR